MQVRVVGVSIEAELTVPEGADAASALHLRVSVATPCGRSEIQTSARAEDVRLLAATLSAALDAAEQ